jgi:Holliday junction resolvase RusA-like endonuclease
VDNKGITWRVYHNYVDAGISEKLAFMPVLDRSIYHTGIDNRYEQGGNVSTVTEIFIPLIPQAQGRPRFARRGNFVSTYDDPKSKSYKHELILFLREQSVACIPADVPISLSVEFFLPRPKSHYDSKGQIKPKALLLEHTKKPDLDNLLKSMKDAAKGYLWHDDSQICRYDKCEKSYCDESPGTLVRVVTR